MKAPASRRPMQSVTKIVVLSACSILCLLPAAASAAGSDSLGATQIIRMIVGLGIVTAAVLLTAKFMPRFGGASIALRDSFHVVSSLAVGQRERVVVLQLGDRQVLVGVAPGRVQFLHLLEQPLDADKNAELGQYADKGWMARVLRGRRL